MTEIEKQALALVNEIGREPYWNTSLVQVSRQSDITTEALCRAIEQHEQFKREVSDVVEGILKCTNANKRYGACLVLNRFILPKPIDPLVEAMREACESQGFATKHTPGELAEHFRAALAKRNAHIVWEAE